MLWKNPEHIDRNPVIEVCYRTTLLVACQAPSRETGTSYIVLYQASLGHLINDRGAICPITSQ